MRVHFPLMQGYYANDIISAGTLFRVLFQQFQNSSPPFPSSFLSEFAQNFKGFMSFLIHICLLQASAVVT